MRFAIAIIFFYPDNAALRRAESYSKEFEKTLIIDNTPDRDLCDLYGKANIDYKWMHGNQGLSIALEYAIKWAREHQVQYLLTMDQDTTYPIVEMEKMKMYIQDHQGAAIYSANWRKIYWDEKLEKKRIGPMAITKDEVVETNFSMTSGSWMDVDKAMEILPLENYFVAYVDMDISLRLKKRGYKILRVGNSVLCQQVGGKVVGNKINVLFKRLLHARERYYYMSRNSLYLIEKYFDDKGIRSMLCRDRARILFNLTFMEENRAEKCKYWKMGISAYREGKVGAMDVNLD